MELQVASGSLPGICSPDEANPGKTRQLRRGTLAAAAQEDLSEEPPAALRGGIHAALKCGSRWDETARMAAENCFALRLRSRPRTTSSTSASDSSP